MTTTKTRTTNPRRRGTAALCTVLTLSLLASPAQAAKPNFGLYVENYVMIGYSAFSTSEAGESYQDQMKTMNSAEQAGYVLGLKMNGERIAGEQGFNRLLHTHAGREVTVTIWRDGEIYDMRIPLTQAN